VLWKRGDSLSKLLPRSAEEGLGVSQNIHKRRTEFSNVERDQMVEIVQKQTIDT
jgi:hypothetical protein